MDALARLDALERRLQRPLPGDEAKSALFPRPRRSPPRPVAPGPPRDAAVLVLLYPLGEDLGLPLMVRREIRGDVHSGQISLPGGGRDGDEDLRATALREAREELGIDPAAVSILGQLSPQWIPVSGYRVVPFVGTTPGRPIFVPDPIEVADVVETSIDLLHDETRREVRRRRLAGREADIPGWRLEQGFLWGATAMILAELLAIVPRRDGRTPPAAV